MKVLALDLSTSTGFAVLQKDGEAERVLERGSFKLENGIEELGEYPVNYIKAATSVAQFCEGLARTHDVDFVVIEETNLGRARYTQKILEFIHLAVLTRLPDISKVRYVSTSEWRSKKLGLSVANTKKVAKPFVKQYQDLKKQFASAAPKSQAKKDLKVRMDELKKDLQHRCIFGKIDKKSISVAFVNATFNMSLKKGQNDVSDAICLGTAFLRGAAVCTNATVFNHDR